MRVQCITSEGDGAAFAPGQELVQPAGEAHQLLHQVELVVCASHHHLTKGLGFFLAGTLREAPGSESRTGRTHGGRAR